MGREKLTGSESEEFAWVVINLLLSVIEQVESGAEKTFFIEE